MDPGEGKALKEELAGLHSFRVSRFRIVYRVKNRVVEIIAVGPRNRIYEEKLLQQEKRFLELEKRIQKMEKMIEDKK